MVRVAAIHFNQIHCLPLEGGLGRLFGCFSLSTLTVLIEAIHRPLNGLSIKSVDSSYPTVIETCFINTGNESARLKMSG